MSDLLLGFSTLSDPINGLFFVAGIFSGIFIGSMPGLDSSLALTLFIPFTYHLGPFTAISFLTGAYCGGIYGGSFTAIMFRIPGSPENAATMFDGNPLARKGQPGKACGVAIFSSSLGGIFGGVCLILFAPPFAKIALAFGPAEYFGFTFFGLMMLSSIGTGSAVKGAISTLLGLFFATVGRSKISWVPRFSFGTDFLAGGIEFVSVLLGVFAMSEIFIGTEKILTKIDTKMKITAQLPSIKEIISLKWTYLRSCLLGVFVGILPALGATAAAFMAYDMERRLSKHPEKFGTGVLEGIAAPEAANNATIGGAFIPMLTLGIPGSGNTAIIMGAFMIHGIVPGPKLFVESLALVNTIFVGIIVGHLLIVAVAMIEVKNMVKVLKIPLGILYPIIAGLTVIGSYSLRNNIYDVWIMMIFGIVGYYFRRYNFSISGLIMGIILGPIIEESFLAANMIFDGNLLMFFQKPISAVFVSAGLGFMAFPIVRAILRAFRKRNIKKPSHS